MFRVLIYNFAHGVFLDEPHNCFYMHLLLLPKQAFLLWLIIFIKLFFSALDKKTIKKNKRLWFRCCIVRACHSHLWVFHDTFFTTLYMTELCYHTKVWSYTLTHNWLHGCRTVSAATFCLEKSWGTEGELSNERKQSWKPSHITTVQVVRVS